MRVSNIQLKCREDFCELQADVKCDAHWVWGDDPFRLWYRYPSEYRKYLDAENGDAFVAACLAPAMVLGEPLEIEAPVSQRLYRSLPKIQSIYRCWDRGLSEVAVRAPVRVIGEANAESRRGKGLFFSMGVDSSYSLWKNLRDHQHDDSSITHLIMVQGFDVYLWESERFPPMLASAQLLAEQFGKRVLPITTNLREFSDRMADWLRLYHGPALASVVLPLGGMFQRVLIAAAQTYTQLIPRGAHPLLDPLWSTEELSFEHDGLEADRLQKIFCLAQSYPLVENLRVCTTGEVTSSYNCGRCEKCIRTMIGLHIAGVLEKCKTLPHEIDAGAVRKLPVPHSTSRQYLEQLVHGLGSTREDAAIKAALRTCLAAGERGRIPIISITGTNGKTTTTRMIAHILALAGRKVGFASTDGVYIGGKRIIKGDQAGVGGARAILADPTVEAAVLESARGGLRRYGLGYLSCDVGVCLNVSNDHLGEHGVETLEELASVKRLVIESALNVAVLNAEDPHCVAMAEYTAAAAVCYVAEDPRNAVVRRQIDSGGIGAVIEQTGEGASLVLYDRQEQRLSLPAQLIPATIGGRAAHNVQNALFAAATAYSAGIAVAKIAEGLQTFSNSFEMSPGRMNFFDDHPFTVVLDFGHNPDGIRMICEMVALLDLPGRRIGLLTSPSNRKKDHFDGIGRAAAGLFDFFVCSNWYNLKGRDPEFVPKCLREALVGQNIEPSRIATCSDPGRAVRETLSMAEPGDVVVIFGDDPIRRAEEIRAFGREESAAG